MSSALTLSLNTGYDNRRDVNVESSYLGMYVSQLPILVLIPDVVSLSQPECGWVGAYLGMTLHPGNPTSNVFETSRLPSFLHGRP